ncbi:hypothetical protein PFISCL1PPCAC_12764 [Pristionchus fissidentatus]|uniref:Uncharacterized protein n=1 Tax=Pristionchus fissidentatus TaxID=1538716 RepID=A0AAV5VRY3_9BILA|nr:hypothetical protein PFISCL1PPCAC_12764 [Pristionchus fissidentatus]
MATPITDSRRRKTVRKCSAAKCRNDCERRFRNKRDGETESCSSKDSCRRGVRKCWLLQVQHSQQAGSVVFQEQHNNRRVPGRIARGKKREEIGHAKVRSVEQRESDRAEVGHVETSEGHGRLEAHCSQEGKLNAAKGRRLVARLHDAVVRGGSNHCGSQKRNTHFDNSSEEKPERSHIEDAVYPVLRDEPTVMNRVIIL